MLNLNNRGSVKLTPRFFLRTAAFSAVLAVCGFLYWANQLLLVITPQTEGKAIMFVIKPGEEWHFSWRHSVHKTIVKEYFRVQGEKKLRLFLVRYDSYGVGMPFLPSEGKLVEKDGKFELYTDRHFDFIPLVTGKEAELELWREDRVIKLYREYPPGTFLRVTAEKRYKYWL